MLQEIWATILVALLFGCFNDKQCRQTASLLALLKPIQTPKSEIKLAVK